MGKQIVYTCDICGKQVKDNPVSNIAVALKREFPAVVMPTFQITRTMPVPVQAQETRTMPIDFDALVCDECLSTKSLSEILSAVSVVAKTATSATSISTVTLKTINNDNHALEGIPMNANPIVIPMAKPAVEEPPLVEQPEIAIVAIK